MKDRDFAIVTQDAIVIIPARGGSKGIPRKNLRPLNGKPLISYSIQAALASSRVKRVVVSTDDEEIALFARRFGADVVMRPEELATDTVPLDPVIMHAVESIERESAKQFELVVTVQPTSPLVGTEDIDAVVDLLASEPVDTVLTAVDDRHLRWQEAGGSIVPAYEHRVNRQLLPPVYRETGAVIGCRRDVLARGSRIGSRVKLHLVEPARSVDIDSVEDIWLCEKMLSRRKVVFTVIGRQAIGLGHVYRALMIAHELVDHELVFVSEEKDDLAKSMIERNNYHVVTCPDGKLLETVLALKPDMVINDVLDTSSDYVVPLKKAGITVVNFEDMGYGAEVADLVVNALYPHQIPSEHILVGPKYFCLRDEFLHTGKHESNENMKRVLVTFGGVDEGNVTLRALEAVADSLIERGIAIDVVLGPGYCHMPVLDEYLRNKGSSLLSVVSSTPRISEFMLKADLAVTSGGRTVLELTAMGVPTIVIAQNQREMTHSFASSENGILNLGLRHDVSQEAIRDAVVRVVDSPELRATMRRKAGQLDLRQGKERVIGRIQALLKERAI